MIIKCVYHLNLILVMHYLFSAFHVRSVELSFISRGIYKIFGMPVKVDTK